MYARIHHTSRGQITTDLHEVAVPILDLATQLASLCFRPRRRQELARRVDIDGRFGTGLQKSDVDRADAGTDVEHTCPIDAVAENDVDELLGCRVEPPFPPSSEIGRRVEAVIAQEREILVATEATPRSSHEPMVRVPVNRSPTAPPTILRRPPLSA